MVRGSQLLTSSPASIPSSRHHRCSLDGDHHRRWSRHGDHDDHHHRRSRGRNLEQRLSCTERPSDHIVSLNKMTPVTIKKPKPSSSYRYADLPLDIVLLIFAAADAPTLRAGGMACRLWWVALRPLREAMLLLRRGKRFKHGSAGSGDARDFGKGSHGKFLTRRDLNMALESFLKGAALGSALAMVDAGLILWEMGKKEEARRMYREAAELRLPVAQCNLGLSYLEDETPKLHEAVKWFSESAFSGYARAQYNLALCLHHGRGVKPNLLQAAKWYLKAAEGGHARSMYNISVCYSTGEGMQQNYHQAEFWLKRAAHSGHRRAQFELGSIYITARRLIKGSVYLELAVRAGDTAAQLLKEEVLQSLPPASRNKVMVLADKWRPVKYSC